MLPLFLAMSTTQLAAAETGASEHPVDARWDLREGAHHRWALETEIVLPWFVRLFADRNIDVRARNIGLKMVLDCTAEAPGKRAGYLRCTVEDAAFTGATFPNERGRLQPVLEEMDRKLTGATADLILRPNGHLRTVKLQTQRISPFRNQRTRYMEEAIRTFFVRAVAVFDIKMPRGGVTDASWPQFESELMGLPTQKGTAGAGRLVHIADRTDPTQLYVSSVGRATLVDGAHLEVGSPYYLETDFTGYTVFDLESGRVDEAVWTTWGEPTASAGVFARPYANRVAARALEAGQTIDLGATEEWRPLWRGAMGFRSETRTEGERQRNDEASTGG
jgi:hypothetical protein